MKFSAKTKMRLSLLRGIPKRIREVAGWSWRWGCNSPMPFCRKIRYLWRSSVIGEIRCFAIKWKWSKHAREGHCNPIKENHE